MDINQCGLLLKEEVYQVVGCAFEVQNTLGHGLLEKSYENALVVECGLRGIPVSQQRRIDVYYKQVKVGDSTLDIQPPSLRHPNGDTRMGKTNEIDATCC
ncbi:GxxExxY protein [Nitrosomonas sp. ANs5]|uniref:GxxExxY protein n=1 Tax=Nitrosomonas sp. ANs5 TaxID=3423941 RepID=UPI003D334FB6